MRTSFNLSLRTSFNLSLRTLLPFCLFTRVVKQSRLLADQYIWGNRITVKIQEVRVNRTYPLGSNSLDCFVPRKDTSGCACEPHLICHCEPFLWSNLNSWCTRNIGDKRSCESLTCCSWTSHASLGRAVQIASSLAKTEKSFISTKSAICQAVLFPATGQPSPITSSPYEIHQKVKYPLTLVS